MDHQSSRYFKIGLFVITAFTVFVCGLVFLGAGKLFEKKQYAETYFDGSVQGLDTGSAVKYKGMKIGSVKSIQSAAATYSSKSRYILVVFSIDDPTVFGDSGKDISEAVRKGLRAKLGLQGLTGSAYLETDFIDHEERSDIVVSWEPQNPYIPAAPSRIRRIGESLDTIIKNLEQINIRGIAYEIDTLLKSINQKINAVDTKKTSESLSLLIAEIRETNSKISSIVDTFDTQTVLDSTLELIKEAGRVVEKSEKPLSLFLKDIAETGKQMKRVVLHAESLIQEIESSFSSLDPALKNFEKACQHIDQAVFLRNNDIKSILETLKTASSNLEEASQNIRLNPSSLLFSSPPRKNIHSKGMNE